MTFLLISSSHYSFIQVPVSLDTISVLFSYNCLFSLVHLFGFHLIYLFLISVQLKPRLAVKKRWFYVALKSECRQRNHSARAKIKSNYHCKAALLCQPFIYLFIWFFDLQPFLFLVGTPFGWLEFEFIAWIQ